MPAQRWQPVTGGTVAELSAFSRCRVPVMFITDITERRRALAALRESDARLKGIAGNVPGLVFRLERDPAEGDLEFPYISEGSEALVGYAPAQIQHPDMGLRNLVHPEDRADYHRVQTWHWPPTKTGPGRGGSSPVRANSAGPTSRPAPGAWPTAGWCGTALSGTSPRASGSSWSWRGPGAVT